MASIGSSGGNNLPFIAEYGRLKQEFNKQYSQVSASLDAGKLDAIKKVADNMQFQVAMMGGEAMVSFVDEHAVVTSRLNDLEKRIDAAAKRPLDQPVPVSRMSLRDLIARTQLLAQELEASKSDLPDLDDEPVYVPPPPVRVVLPNAPHTYQNLAEMPYRYGLINSSTDCFLLSGLQLLAHKKPLQLAFPVPAAGATAPAHLPICHFLQDYSTSKRPFKVVDLRINYLGGLDGRFKHGQQDAAEAFNQIFNTPGVNQRSPVFNNMARETSIATVCARVLLHPLTVFELTPEERREGVTSLQKSFDYYFNNNHFTKTPQFFIFNLIRQGINHGLPFYLHSSDNRKVATFDHDRRLLEKVDKLLRTNSDCTAYSLSDQEMLIKAAAAPIYFHSKNGRVKEITHAHYEEMMRQATETLGFAPHEQN